MKLRENLPRSRLKIYEEAPRQTAATVDYSERQCGADNEKKNWTNIVPGDRAFPFGVQPRDMYKLNWPDIGFCRLRCLQLLCRSPASGTVVRRQRSSPEDATDHCPPGSYAAKFPGNSRVAGT